MCWNFGFYDFSKSLRFCLIWWFGWILPYSFTWIGERNKKTKVWSLFYSFAMLFVEILIFTSFLKACGFAWFGGLVGFFLVAVGLMCLRRCFFLGLRCVNLFARQRRPPSCRIRNREKKGTFCETKNGLAFNSNSEPFSRHALFVTRVKLGFVTPKQDQNRPHYWTLLGAHSRN